MEALQLINYSGSREIFETLLRFTNRKFTINELAKEAKVPFASTWRLIKRWEQAGLIETGRVGKSVTVKLHKSEYSNSIASLLKLSMTPQAFTAKQLTLLLAKIKEVKEAYLFGSITRKEEKLESDIDVALLVEPHFNVNELVFEVYDKYGTKIVPLTFFNKPELESFMTDKGGERLK